MTFIHVNSDYSIMHHLVDPGREGHPGTESDGDRSAVAPHQVDVW